MSDQADDQIRVVLLTLRDLRVAFHATVDAFDVLLEDPTAAGFDLDPVADFDERNIVLEYLGSIRRGQDDLLRMLAALKGRDRLAALIPDEPQRANTLECRRCGITLWTAEHGAPKRFMQDNQGAWCQNEASCSARAYQTKVD